MTKTNGLDFRVSPVIDTLKVLFNFLHVEVGCPDCTSFLSILFKGKKVVTGVNYKYHYYKNRKEGFTQESVVLHMVEKLNRHDVLVVVPVTIS